MKKSFLLLSIATATLLSAQTVKSISYKNLSRISPKIANETILLKPGKNFSDKDINDSLKKFYAFNYFEDIQVFNNNGQIEFIFTEKPSIANIVIKGYKTAEGELELLYANMGIRKGSMYTKERVEKAKESLLNELQKEGYINSVVEIDKEVLNEDSLALTFNVNKGDEILIKKASYIGAKYLEQSDFDDVTANKEEEFMSWWFGQNSGELKLDQMSYESRRINDLYYQHGFLDAKVKDPFMTIDFASNAAQLDFNISEGIQYTTNDIKIYVNSSIIKEQELYDVLRLEKDDIFDINKLRKDVDAIKTKIANLGYAFTQVKYDLKKDIKNKNVSIVFNVIPGKKVYINDVIISGNTRTLDRVVRRNVYLAPGDLYNLTDLKDSKNKLGRSSFFENVEIKEQRISDTKMNLLVEVQEASTGSLTLGGGYGSYDGMLINASISDKNIFGSGLSLGFSVDLSKKKNNYTVSLKNPAINDSKYNGEVKVYNNEREYDYTNYDLETETRGISLGFGKSFFRHMYAGLRYKFEMVYEKYDYKTAYTGTEADKKKDQDYNISSFTPYVSYDNTDDYYVPREGFKSGASYEVAGIGGDAKFHKAVTYLKYFYGFRDIIDYDAIFRYKTKVGVLFNKGFITEGQSFYLGGPSSLRGFESYAFGPEDSDSDDPYKRTFTNAVELSFPLIESAKMRWGLFYDYGMIGKDSFSEIKRSGTGALVEWISPVGPLQFIFSKAIDAEAGDNTSSFEFSLGTNF